MCVEGGGLLNISPWQSSNFSSGSQVFTFKYIWDIFSCFSISSAFVSSASETSFKSGWSIEAEREVEEPRKRDLLRAGCQQISRLCVVNSRIRLIANDWY